MSIRDDLNVKQFSSPYMEAVLNVLFTGHWLTDETNKVLRPMGLTEPQFNVLTLIYAARGKPISSQVIQSGMIQRQSNVTRIVDKLVRRGWVTRDTCPENRRKVDITITEEGKEAYKNARKAVMGFHSRLMGKISNKDAEQLSMLLDVLRTE